MYKLSNQSKKNLSSCNPEIKDVVHHVLKFIDVGVAEGHRGKERQNSLFQKKKTKVHWPNSKHNTLPSDAIDLVVFVKDFGYIDENSAPKKYRQYYGFLAGIINAYCFEKNYNIRWGGDWNSNADFNEPSQNFDDLVHFEITSKKKY